MNVVNRNCSVDLLKFILAFFVVALHGHFLKDSSLLLNQLTVNGIFRIAVPIFFIINGFYFFKVINTPKNWFKRVSFLYLFWMLIYGYFWLDLAQLKSLNIFGQLKIIFFGYFHLWYLPAMLGAAFILLLLKNQSNKLLFVLSISLFIVGVIGQYFINYFNVGAIYGIKSLYFYRNFIFFGVPFFFIGFLINKIKFYEDLSVRALVIASVFSFILLILESYLNYNLLQGVKGFDFLLSLIIVCPAIFLLASKVEISGQTKFFSSSSSVIYFVHPLILTILYKLFNINNIELIVYTLIVSIFLSKAIFFLNKKYRAVGLIF